MRKLGKLAAAFAAAAALTSLTACGNSVTPEMEQIAAEMDGQIIKSKITGADSAAHEFVNEVNTYISDCVTYGGKAWESGTIKIIVKGDNWTASGYNANAYKPKKVTDTLLERIQNDFSGMNDAYVEIHINEQGRAYSALYTENPDVAVSDIPPLEAFDEGSWTWNGKNAGVSPSGIIVGTSPKLLLKEKKSSGIFG